VNKTAASDAQLANYIIFCLFMYNWRKSNCNSNFGYKLRTD